MSNKDNLPSKTGIISRREFARRCTIGTVALAAGSILTFDTRKTFARGVEKSVFPMDQDWLFGGKFDPAASPLADSAFSKITLPHCVTKLSWENWNPTEWQNTWIYRRHFAVPKEWANRRVFVKFDAVMTSCRPSVNGTALPEHVGGYLPFQYELTKLLKADDNILDVVVDSRWQHVPPDGNPKGAKSVDYLEPGGIVRSVSLLSLPQVFISDVFAKPVDVLDAKRSVDVTWSIDAAAASANPVEIKVELMDNNRVIASDRKIMLLEKQGVTEASLTLSDLGKVKLWDFDSPHLYEVVTTLLMDSEKVHEYRTRIGFREAKFTVDGFFLNGKRRELFGLDRHEVYPYVGTAMPPRVMRHDAKMLRHEFNCNMVRCSHYPQTEAFLDACDELGLMVWQETPGWGYIGDHAWEDLVVQNVTDMILRDRNHASIVIWGVRVNESRNDQPLYRRTTAIAKKLDGTRPTSGSMTNRRNWQSEWHQDVFAMDDYHNAPDGSVGIDKPVPGVPYMLSETVGGFSYGAKGFNNKYRRAGDLKLQTDQGLFHAQAHEKVAQNKNNSGAIAWCAFDYSSLMNCYNAVKCPGVADVFRIPKLAAGFYLSQTSPKPRPVILPNFYWDFGPKSPNGPGKNASIFSNCEKLEVFVAGKKLAAVEADRKTFSHLRFPPFFCDLELDGAGHPELRIDGYVGGKKVLSRSFSSDASKDQFDLKADDKELIADGADATRVVFKVVDKFGAERAFADGTVGFEITGPGTIIGDNPFALTDSGGVGAVWVKTLPNKTGRIKLTATHSSLGGKSVEINVQTDEQV